MEKHERLKLARTRRYRTAKDAAAALSVPYGTYSGHESGTRGFSETEARQYSAKFRVRLSWLLLEDGAMDGHGMSKDAQLIPVMGRVGAGAQIEPEFEQVGPEGLFEVEVAIPLPPDMIGFEVVGDSMYPRYDDGDVVICSRDGEPQAITHGDEAAVRTSDGRRYLKKVMRAGESFDLESHNAPPIRGVGLEWASPVVLTVHRSRWRKLGNGKPALGGKPRR